MLNVPDMPEAATFEEWDEWQSSAKAKHPVRYFLSWTLPITASRLWRQWIHDPWYWLKCRVWYRHNVLVIHSLPPTWTDRDERLLHAAFQILVDFIEQEECSEWSHVHRTREQLIADYDTTYEGCDPEHAADIRKHAEERADDWLAIKALYDWWTVERPARKEPEATGGYTREWGDRYREFEESCDAEDDEMLIKLIKLRGYLWT